MIGMSGNMTLFLDIDNTLYDQSRPFCLALSEFFEGRYDAISEKVCRLYAKRSQESFYARERGEMTEEEMHVFRLQRGLEDAGIAISDSEAREMQFCYESYQKRIQSPEETLAFLRSCSDMCVRLGIISNGPGKHQRGKLETLGIADFFEPDLIVISGEIGFAKPDPRIFDYAARLAGEGRLSYIGDSMENDVLPAKALGWTAIHYSKDPSQWKSILDEMVRNME